MTIPNVEIRVYNSFSEIRTRVQSDAGNLELLFSRNTWRSIEESSITLIDLSFSTKTVIPQENWLTAFEGHTVWVRRLEGLEEVTLVRAEDLLVQDKNGAYYRTAEEQLLFPHMPPLYGSEGSVLLNFQISEAGEGLLSYTTGALTWKSQYVLDLKENGEASLTAQASLHNQLSEDFQPEMLELIAGDTRQLGGGRFEFRAAAAMRRDARIAYAQEAPTWRESDDDTEIGGFYRYSLQNPPRIAAGSTVTIPFEDIRLLLVEQMALLNTRFTTEGKTSGIFERHCRIQAASPLLSSTVILRDQGYLVSEAHVGETAAGSDVNFHLGREPKITYQRGVTRKSEVIEPLEDNKVKKTTTYEVSYVLRNTSKLERRFEITENTRYLNVQRVVQAELTDRSVVKVNGVVLPEAEMTLQFEVLVEGMGEA